VKRIVAQLALFLCLFPALGSSQQAEERALAAMLKARYAQARGDYERALSYVDQAMALAADDADIAFLKVEIMRELEETLLVEGRRRREASVELISACIERFPRDYRFYKAMGLLLVRDIKAAGAFGADDPSVYLEKALALMDPDDESMTREMSDVYFHLGRWLMRQERYYDASVAFENVCKLEPQQAWSWYYAAQTAETAHRLRTALAAYRRFGELKDDSRRAGLPARLTLAALEAMLDPGEANLDRLLALARENDISGNLLYGLAQKFGRAGQFAQALAVLGLTPAAERGGSFLRLRIELLLRSGRCQEALSGALEALQDNSSFQRNPRLDRLIVDLALDAAMLCRDHDAVISLALNYGPERKDDLRMALADAFAAFLRDGDAAPWSRLVETFKENPQVAASAEEADRHGLAVVALRRHARTQMAWERWDDARKLIENGLAEGLPRDALLDELALTYAMTDRFERSFAAFEALMAREPQRVDLWNNYGYFLAVAGVSLEKARALAGKALEAEPGNEAYLDTMAWVLHKQGRHEEAEAFLRRALAGDPRDAVKLEHLGDVLAAMGRESEARRHWSEAMESAQDRYFDILDKLDPAQ